MSLIIFKNERLDPALRKKLSAAAAELSRHLGREFVAGTSLWGWRVPIARAEGYAIVPAFAVGWPRDSSIIAVDEEGNVLLPRIHPNDFATLCSKLKLNSEEELARLRELVSPAKFDWRDRRNWRRPRT